MKKRRVISRSSLPTHLPISETAVVWLILDRAGASGVAQGVVWTLLSIVWLAAIVLLLSEEQVDILDREEQ
jgi:hypothetical protein